MESERPDALFRDPYARRLVGERAEELIRFLAKTRRSNPRVMAVRTKLIDDMIVELISREGVDTVVNLAAGLDSRPYRLDLPASLHWIEVDLPEILSEKEKALAGEQPRCSVERVKLDLRELRARHRLFERLNANASKALILTEGLLMYIPPDEVKALARDFHQYPRFVYWLTDLLSPFELFHIRRKYGSAFARANAEMKFAPKDGADFFRPLGWEPYRHLLFYIEAERLNRDTWPFRIARLLSPVLPANYLPRYGVVYLKRRD